MTYGLNDICLVPARISDIEHRKQCNPYSYEIGKVPFDVVDDPFFTDGFRTAKRC